MTYPAGCYSLMVERPEIAQVIGDQGTALSARKRQHLRV
jgi:hypothetical protein